MSEKILEVKNLKVELEGQIILDRLSFEVKKGEVVTILGPNGAGKSVLLKTLLGIFPYQGEIRWQKGIKIGYVPQRVPFVKDFPLRVEEFLALKEKDKKTIRETIKIIGFEEEILKKNIGTLSSGQYQRILVAFALLKNPDVLLFDEPTAGIDMVGKESIYHFLSKLKEKRGLTILLVTHDLSVVFKFSDYVVCLNKTPFCQGRPKEVVNVSNLSKLYGEQIKFYFHYHDG